MITEEIGDVLTGDELGLALLLGCVCLLVAIVAARTRRACGEEAPVPLVGLLVAVAGAAAIASSSTLPWEVVLGLALLATAGSSRSSPLVGAPLALVGGAAVASAVPTGPRWIAIAVVATSTVGGFATAGFDRRAAATGLGPVLFALSAVGVYVTVPETNAAVPLMGVAVPLALAAWPRAHARLGDAGALAAVGLLAWVAASGGVVRPSSVIGGLASLGILVVEPASRALLAGRAPAGIPARSVVVGVHIVVVVLVARVAGLRSSTVAALLIASTVLVVATIVMTVLIRVSKTSP